MKRQDASLAYLLGRVAVVETLVQSAVRRRRGGDPAQEDRFRGLYFSEEAVERMLAPSQPGVGLEDDSRARLESVETDADAAEKSGEPVRLRRLARFARLAPLDIDLLLLALVPDLDARFESLYSFLHDDVTRRRVSAGLALELCGASAIDHEARRRLGPRSALVAGGLVCVEEDGRPFLSRALRVPDRVTMHLLGDDEPDPLLVPLLSDPLPSVAGDAAALARAFHNGASLTYLRQRTGASARDLAAEAFAQLRLPTVALDLHRVAEDADLPEIARAALREARLRGAGLVAGPVEALVPRGAAAVRELAELAWPTVLTGSGGWDPEWSRSVPLVLDAPGPTPEDRVTVWRAMLNGEGNDLDAASVTASFKLDTTQIERAAHAATLHAVHDDRPLSAEHLRLGARAQNLGGLERLAHRIEPSVGWDDLVLPPQPLQMLHEVADRVRLRPKVLHDWGMRQGGRRGDGIAAVFAGPSGTGKTMAAEVVAGDLGFDLYTVDLATVVDKYIGETEKNLERIFTQAEQVNGVLFFDEADALFGKRSEVRDAHDRYANVEVSYLLQRMESFDGIAILATNLKSNLDSAFARRLDAFVNFPMPDEQHRKQLWERCLGPLVPRSDELNLEFCARAFELAGGNIRNITLGAAYLAAAEDRPVATADLIRSTEREFRKLGKLCLEREFGPYFHLVS